MNYTTKARELSTVQAGKPWFNYFILSSSVQTFLSMKYFVLTFEISGKGVIIMHRRRKRGGGGRGGQPPPPIILEGGGQHTLWPPPNNPPAFSFNFYVKKEKITNVPS